MLLRLQELTGESDYGDRASQLLSSFAAELERGPTFSEMLLAFELRSGAKEIVVVGPENGNRKSLASMLDPLRRNLLTARVLVLTFEGKRQDRTSEVVSLAARKPARAGRVTAYVCEARVCQLPTNDPAVFAGQLGLVR